MKKKNRFQGTPGKAELGVLLAEQKLLHGTTLAATLAEVADPEGYAAAEPIYHEGEEARRVIWFLLGGSVRIEKGLKTIATLGRGQFFGEFPLLDPTARYTVSITAIESTWVARVPWDTFHALSEQHPVLWRNMACELAQRLRATSAPGAGKPDDWKEVLLQFAKRVTEGLMPRPRGLLFLACLSYALIGVAVFLWLKAPEATRCSLLARSPLAAPAPSVAPAASAQ